MIVSRSLLVDRFASPLPPDSLRPSTMADGVITPKKHLRVSTLNETYGALLIGTFISIR